MSLKDNLFLEADEVLIIGRLATNPSLNELRSSIFFLKSSNLIRHEGF